MQFYDWYETDNHLWMLLEYCAGGNLEDLIVQERCLPTQTILGFARQLSSSLSYLHDRDIIYLDLNPKTILLDTQGQLRLSGFGRAARKGHKLKARRPSRWQI